MEHYKRASTSRDNIYNYQLSARFQNYSALIKIFRLNYDTEDSLADGILTNYVAQTFFKLPTEIFSTVKTICDIVYD